MNTSISQTQDATPVKKPILSRKHKEWIWGYVFIAPTVVGLFVFLIGPIFFSFYISMSRWDNLNPPQFIGFDNYIRMFTDSMLHLEIRNTLLFAVFIVPFTVIMPLLVAVMLSVKAKWIGFFRVCLFLPWVTSGIAAAMVWQNMFMDRFGMVNGFLRRLGIPVVGWLSSPHTVFGIVVAMSVWAALGYYAIIYLVGLKNLPASYNEAAAIDGANKMQVFFKITIPLLTPQIFFVLTMTAIGAFQMFDAILVFGANPHIRDGIRTVAFGIFDRGFNFQQMGYASANAIVLLIMIMAVTLLNFVFQKFWVHYDN